MAQFFGIEDDEDLKQLVWGNNCNPIPKITIENFAISYNFNYSTVKNRIKNIIESSYRDKRGNWKCRYRVTRGQVVTQSFVKDAIKYVNNCKSAGTAISYKTLAKICRVSEIEAQDLVNDLI